MSLRPLSRLPRQLSRRAFSTFIRLSATSFQVGPAPPRLPKEEQEVFERLQKQSTGAFSQPRPADTDADAQPSETPRLRMQINQSPDSASPSSSSSSSSPVRLQVNQSPDSASPPSASSEGVEIKFENGKAIQKGEEFHPNMRRGAPPEFEGDVNPKTGEVGGPKNEPLRWGGGADWSYNGRVTDF